MTMKTYLLMALVFCALIILPASATANLYGSINFAGNASIGYNLTMETRAQLCAHYGLTAGAYPYPSTYYPDQAMINVNNDSGCYLKQAGSGIDGGTWTVPGQCWNGGASWTNTTYITEEAGCSDGKSYVYNQYHISTVPPPTYPPVADFNGTPLMGLPPLMVVFKDNSTNTPTAWNWSVSPAGGVYIANASTQDTSMIFTLEGNYTITHGASNSGGSSTKTRTDYIWVQNNTAITTTYVTAISQSSGNPIPGAVINLQDVENSSWVNATTGSSATANITTLKGHTINGYASAPGFNDNDYLGMASGQWYSILLMSPFTANVTAGNVTLNVNVYDSFGHAPINGAGVTVISNVSQVNGYTNSAGVASFAVKNKTTYLVDVEAVGQQYKGATQSVYTGTGSGGSASVTATFYLDKNNAITPTATITTLPGGGTPTPTQTYLAGCDPSSSTYDAATCRGSHSNSALNFLADNMDNLIMVCVFVTILYLFGIKLGR
jgi:PKD repeat protein